MFRKYHWNFTHTHTHIHTQTHTYIHTHTHTHAHTHFNSFNRIKICTTKQETLAHGHTSYPNKCNMFRARKSASSPITHPSHKKFIHAVGLSRTHSDAVCLHAHGPSFSLPPHSLSLSHTHARTHARACMQSVRNSLKRKEAYLLFPKLSCWGLCCEQLFLLLVPLPRIQAQPDLVLRDESFFSPFCFPVWFFIKTCLISFHCRTCFLSTPNSGSFGNIVISKELEGRKFELHWIWLPTRHCPNSNNEPWEWKQACACLWLVWRAHLMCSNVWHPYGICDDSPWGTRRGWKKNQN